MQPAQRLVRSLQCWHRPVLLSLRSFSTTKKPSDQPPEAPVEGACCGQNCPQCVWITYAYDVADFYSGEKIEDAIATIEQKVPDPNVRAFVIAELQMKAKKK
ncbi:unnamed protein product [Nippostrongylus brasiliensis]|uniref:Oxidoreductase-like domain-containing protein n=1 Tax=Nippostrongylus brasiliensis TaxID=27835 RepID=A0A0N4Y3K2_NIPBR|nr:hypothetical protein Q1695_015725 [Nippostrongylus brasiliensis]VDL73988.1 unnamed protein product [Nippostrongylus brasiliensis]